jgi:hypothetical protein|nr:hypothetical protein [uncultured Treponema sp.]
MAYYLDDYNSPFAMDEKGNEFYVTKKGLIPARKGRIDFIMWENVTKERAEECAQ